MLYRFTNALIQTPPGVPGGVPVNSPRCSRPLKACSTLRLLSTPGIQGSRVRFTNSVVEDLLHVLEKPCPPGGAQTRPVLVSVSLTSTTLPVFRSLTARNHHAVDEPYALLVHRVFPAQPEGSSGSRRNPPGFSRATQCPWARVIGGKGLGRPLQGVEARGNP